MIEQLFGSKTRVKLLKLFVNSPNRSFFVREITRKIDEQINSVRRELSNLESIGIVKSESQNNKKYYEVNQKSKFYEPMRGLFVSKRVLEAESGSKSSSKTGKAKVASDDGTNLLTRIQKLGSVHMAILSGSFTRDKSAPADMLIVGEVGKAKLKKLVAELEKEEGRELTYVALKRSEFDYRIEVNDRFITKMLDAKYTTVLDEDNLL